VIAVKARAEIECAENWAEFLTVDVDTVVDAEQLESFFN
jgi:hypothetical protein